MSIRKMRIRIGQNGQTKIQVENGDGEGCLAFTRSVEEALGKVEERQLTAEYHELDPLAVTTHEQIQEGAL